MFVGVAVGFQIISFICSESQPSPRRQPTEGEGLLKLLKVTLSWAGFQTVSPANGCGIAASWQASELIGVHLIARCANSLCTSTNTLWRELASALWASRASLLALLKTPSCNRG